MVNVSENEVAVSKHSKVYHIAVSKKDSIHFYKGQRGPRCGQDRKTYEEDDIEVISESKAQQYLDENLLCENCAEYYGL